MDNQQESHKFKKGQSGNPKGRKIGSFSLVTILKNKLQEIPEDQKEDYAHLLMKKMIDKALKDGDATMIKDIVSRVDGLPKASLDIGIDDDLKEAIAKINSTLP